MFDTLSKNSKMQTLSNPWGINFNPKKFKYQI